MMSAEHLRGRPGGGAARWRRFGRRGALAAEFALVVPVVALVLFATVDLVLFLRAQVKVESTAVQIGQAVSQCDRITTPGDVNAFWQAAQALIGGVADVSANGAGTVIITAVNSVAGANRVAWQVRSNARATSAIGSPGGAASIPAGYLVPSGQLLIATEVLAPVRPWILSGALMNAGVVPATLRGVSFYLSRSPDPSTVASAPVNNDARVCMA